MALRADGSRRIRAITPYLFGVGAVSAALVVVVRLLGRVDVSEVAPAWRDAVLLPGRPVLAALLGGLTGALFALGIADRVTDGFRRIRVVPGAAVVAGLIVVAAGLEGLAAVFANDQSGLLWPWLWYDVAASLGWVAFLVCCALLGLLISGWIVSGGRSVLARPGCVIDRM